MDDKSKVWGIRIAAGVGGIALLAVALPLIYSAFLASLGVLGIGVTALVGYAIIRAVPLLAQKWENWVLGMQKAEARRNPIEQMENRLLEKVNQLAEYRVACTHIKTQIDSLARMVREQQRTDPGHDVSDMITAVQRMQEFYENMLVKGQAATKALEEMQTEIKRKRVKWEFQLAANTALANINSREAQAVLKDLLADEAFQHVENKFDQTFAMLDTEVRMVNQTKRLDFGKNVTLDLTAITIPEKVPR
jgi:hypothetical protein